MRKLFLGLILAVAATACHGQAVGGKGVGPNNCGGVPGTSGVGCGGVPGAPAYNPTVPTTKTCANGGGADVNTVTCTWSSAPAAGETVACYLINYLSGGGPFSVTDSAGNTYNAIGSAHTLTALSGVSQMFYFTLGSSITTTTMHDPSANFLTLLCGTANNIALTSPVDGTQCTSDSATTSIPCSTAITTTQNGDWVFCGAFANAGTLTQGTGFTAGATNGPNELTQYLVQPTAGAITPNMTGTSGSTAMTCNAFKS